VPELNPNTPGEAARLAAKIALGRHRIPKTISAKVVELSDGGLAPFEIAPHVGLPPALVTLILRAEAPRPSGSAPARRYCTCPLPVGRHRPRQPVRLRRFEVVNLDDFGESLDRSSLPSLRFAPVNC
jgi:hypothetical protein